jgi:hypothetical protein
METHMQKIKQCKHCGWRLRLVSIQGNVVWAHPRDRKWRCDKVRAKLAAKAAESNGPPHAWHNQNLKIEVLAWPKL